MTRCPLALLLLIALAVPAGAQSRAYQDWRQVLDDRQMDNLDRAAWFRKQLKGRGEAGIARLRGFVLDPFGARGLVERTCAALALKYRGLRQLEAALGEIAADALAAMAVEPSGKNPWFADPDLEDAALVERLGSTDSTTRKAAARTLVASPKEKSLDFRAALSQAYGVEVETPAANKRWARLPEIMASATPLPAEAVRVADRRLLLALAAYPARMVRPRLEKIVVMKKLRVRGTSYGGTYRDKVLYLAAGGQPNLDFTRAFHHEFSSLLMKSAPFPDAAWQAIHDADPVYGHGGRWAIYMGRTGVGTVDLYQKGFFRPYALADLENDFNVFSETAMTYPHWARVMAARFPRLGRKWKTWCAFLKSLDTAFTPPLPAAR